MQPKVITLADCEARPFPHERDSSASLAAIITHAQLLAADAAVRRPLQPTSGKFVRRIIAARAARRDFFASDLFADPAWDILLELYALNCEQQRTSVSKLCLAAGVPATTALRWIDTLHGDGLIVRTPDPMDSRRVWVAISSVGLDAMMSYLSSLSPEALPL